MNPGDSENGDPRATVASALLEAISRNGRVTWRTTGDDRYLYRPDECLVDTAFERELSGILREEGARRTRCHSREARLLEKLGIRRWRMVDGRDAKDVIDRVRARGGKDTPPAAVALTHVFAGAPIFRFGPGDLPRDDGPAPVEAEPSTKRGTGKGVQISILDTGFVQASTSLHPLLAQGYGDDGDDRDTLYDDATNPPLILSVLGGHGTFIAGIIRQQAPDTELDPEVTLDDVGLIDDVELALDLLRTRSAHIVNLSLAGPTENDTPPPALHAALTHLKDNSDAVFVAAAGNDYEGAAEAGSPDQKMWPAAFGGMEGFEHVVGVAAVQRDGEPASFTNRGPWVKACAYGVDERSTYLQGDMTGPAGVLSFPDGTAKWSGTSFAAPRVAGIIAATMTARDPSMSAREALDEILQHASDGPSNCGRFVD